MIEINESNSWKIFAAEKVLRWHGKNDPFVPFTGNYIKPENGFNYQSNQIFIVI